MYANSTYYQYYAIPVYDTPSVAGSNKGPEAVIAWRQHLAKWAMDG